jgi:hypothetical protein
MAQPVWNTPAGNLGTFPPGITIAITLSADPILPATSLTYKLLSGSLPAGTVIITSEGLLSGIPSLQDADVRYDFTVRVTDNTGNIRDRSFYVVVSGADAPTFTSEQGSILTTVDSLWVYKQIEYNNPIPTNEVSIELLQGNLPPGLEINSTGLIRGYPLPPVRTSNLGGVFTQVTSSSASTNLFTCVSTTGFLPNRPITFSGLVFGGVIASTGLSTTTYYVKTVESSTTFTISATPDGPIMTLSSGSGTMAATLPVVSAGTPATLTYNFTLVLLSALGRDTANYSITVTNERIANPPNTRVPTILNNKPLSFTVGPADQNYSYYTTGSSNYIGKVFSGDEFFFKVLGYDFDNTNLIYDFANLPLGLTGEVNTGWVTGQPILNAKGISNFSFSARAVKATSPSISSPFVTFTFDVVNELDPTIQWITSSDLGGIVNGTVSNLYVEATAGEPIKYRVTSGALPPSLFLLDTGEIAGRVAYQPAEEYIEYGSSSSYNFTVEAYSTDYPLMKSSRDFVLTVQQDIRYPLETMYFKATPSLNDRNIINNLLSDTTLIPDAYLYRKEDSLFGKASNVIYPFAYGMSASTIEQYLQAINQNHYWKNITLGELKTARAKNPNNETIYEVVYSEIIDDLVNPDGISISKNIQWPKPIDLNLGPWYISNTDIYANYDFEVNGDPTYYASLSPDSAYVLHPNSLPNMQAQLSEYIAQDIDSRLLPLWMTSQQENGSTLGFTKAWVICYTLPGYAETVKNNITTNWQYKLNQINFTLDRYTVDKSYTYNYNSHLSIPAWNQFPSATPVPDPVDSNDFYVLFPRQTILPNGTSS